MKYVTAVWAEDQHGFQLDPTVYLEKLPEFVDELPAGARNFADDPRHYDLGPANSHCVKDLELLRVDVTTDKSGILTLEFAPNQWKHDSGLRITYSGVRNISVDYHHSIDWMAVDTVLLDEILPNEGGGCAHEIALTDAVIRIQCKDLQAVWMDAD